MSKAQPNESEAVRTTIVGGRPPGSGRNNVTVPRGIEVLVKKASVDAEFRELLLTQRGKAAAAIQLELDPAEDAILDAIPQTQLAQIVDQTTVPMELRSAFLGRVAPVMLAALGVGLAGAAPAETAGIQPKQPEITQTNVTTREHLAFAILGAMPGVVTGVPTLPPTNSPPVELPPGSPTNPPSTNLPSPAIRGVQPDRPIAIFGVMMTPPAESSPTNEPPAQPPSTNMNAAPPVYLRTNFISTGIRPSLPTVPVAGAMAVPPPTNATPTEPSPANPPPAVIKGLRADMVPAPAQPTNAPSTNPPTLLPPDGVLTAGLRSMISPTNPPPANPPSTNPPPTNAALPTNRPTIVYSLRVIGGIQPSLPTVPVAGAMAVPPPTNAPPVTNASDTKPQPRPFVFANTP